MRLCCMLAHHVAVAPELEDFREVTAIAVNQTSHRSGYR